MAWDTERTKRLLLDAATAEFSAYGLAGARIDRIAATAGVNKERIYQYFGKKDELFARVLAGRLRASMDEVQMTGTGPEAVGEYAGRLFDHHLADGVIPRLVFWEGLERGAATAADLDRAAYHAEKVELFRRLLPGVGAEAAGQLLLTIVSLVNAWPVLGHLDTFLVGDGPDAADRRRAVVVATATVLARDALARAGATGDTTVDAASDRALDAASDTARS
ncbi:AcrR family transcriptional regulator [Agromyces sp. 3263]|uniref:TetR/AcrR family transcriptional regulator n=1 Tax=Agromyces sp. 3263 TaxID=2817750 RepID=UPI00285DC8BA|nr:TetR family transcriptional regulator [Agromyces sp. 3263]MDR6906529.1 AcrR family transcriptional regulator [Agromyces sp. 3263]